MEKPFREIVDMHTKISNDPWVPYRIQRRQQEEAIKLMQDDIRKGETLDWYTKTPGITNMDRFMMTQRQECEMLRKMQIEKERIEVLKNSEKLEQNFGHILERNKNLSLYSERNSQHLRENDPQLRILASQLREAYVNKIRLGQIDEKERLKQEIVKQDLPYVRALEEQIKKDEETERYAQFLADEKKYLFRKQLEAQMKEKEMFNKMNDTTEADKERIERIIKANIEEIQSEKEREHANKMAVRKALLGAMQMRQDDLEKERIRLKEEEEKLKQFIKFTDDRSAEHRMMKEKKQQMLNKVQEQLGELLEQKRRDIEEFEAARQDVAIAEAELAAFRHEKTEKENKEKAKQQYIKDLNEFRDSTEAAAREERQRDLELDHKVNQINNEKEEEYRQRKLREMEKNENFKEDCKNDIEERRKEKERCHEENKRNQRELDETNKKYEDSVAKERIAMIKEMAPHLYPGCIPRGMLKDEDIEFLDEPLRSFLQSKKPYPDENDYC